jgi:DNA adenine methylase
MAPLIVQELGTHTAYYEPFAGSMAVLLAKPESSQETVNDLHNDLINLAMVVASDRAVDLYERLARTLFAGPLFDAAKDDLDRTIADPPENPADVDDSHVDRAYLYFFVSWAGRNGLGGNVDATTSASLSVRYTIGGTGSRRFANVVDLIPAWHKRLRAVTILHRDALDLIERIDDSGGPGDNALYVDPPYLADSRASGNYLHDFHKDADHIRLAEALRRFDPATTRVVVSYYADESLAELYPGWTIRDCSRPKLNSNPNTRTGDIDVAPEVLVINGPSYADRQAPSLFGDLGGPLQ